MISPQTILTVSILGALAGCDYVTRMERTATFAEPVPFECIETALKNSPSLLDFRTVGDRPELGREYSVSGTNGATVSVLRSVSQPEDLTVSFGWLGKTGNEENAPSQELLEGVYDSIVFYCSNNFELLQETRLCSENIRCEG